MREEYEIKIWLWKFRFHFFLSWSLGEVRRGNKSLAFQALGGVHRGEFHYLHLQKLFIPFITGVNWSCFALHKHGGEACRAEYSTGTVSISAVLNTSPGSKATTVLPARVAQSRDTVVILLHTNQPTNYVTLITMFQSLILITAIHYENLSARRAIKGGQG